MRAIIIKKCLSACIVIIIIILVLMTNIDLNNNITHRQARPPEVEQFPPPSPTFPLRSSSRRDKCSDLKRSRAGSCPDIMDWLPDLAAALPPRAHWRHVDIGANKGYGIANVITALSPDSVVTGLDVYRYFMKHVELPRFLKNKHKRGDHFMQSHQRNVLCGWCGDCLEDVHKIADPAHRAGSLELIAVDLMPMNAHALREIFRNFSSIVTVKNVGIAQRASTVHMNEKEGPGWEQGSVFMGNTKTSDSTTAVEVMPLPQLLGGDDVFHVDYLSTDTEGFDYEVFLGAKPLFRRHKISVYVFETNFGMLPADHPNSLQNGFSLTKMLTELHELGYRCLMPTERLRQKGKSKKSPPPPLPSYFDFTPCLGKENQEDETEEARAIIESKVGFSNVLCYDTHNETVARVFASGGDVMSRRREMQLHGSKADIRGPTLSELFPSK
eukprot:PhM_4_TR17424/c0_g4_i5/m.87557